MKTILLFLLAVVHCITDQDTGQFKFDQDVSLQLAHDIQSPNSDPDDKPIQTHHDTNRKLLQATQTIWQVGDYELLGLDNRFSVHTTTKDDQYNTAVNVLKGGNLVFSWLSTHFTGTSGPVPSTMLQVLDKTRQPLSSEIQLNPNTQTTAGLSPILRLDNGGFISIWNGEENGQYNIYGKRFDSSGTQQGDLFMISNQSSILGTTIPHGTCKGDLCVATWHSAALDIQMQRFYVNGTTIGDEKVANVDTLDEKYYAKVFFVSPKKYMIAWLDGRNFSANNGYSIYGQLFNQNGTRLLNSDLQINLHTYPSSANYWYLAVDSFNDDRGILGWQARNNNGIIGIFYQIVDSNGGLVKAIEEEVNAVSNTPTRIYISIAVSPDDNTYGIIWLLRPFLSLAGSVRGQFFKSNTIPVGGEVVFSSGDETFASRPDIAMSGRCIVVGWQSQHDADNSLGVNAWILELIRPTQAPTYSPTMTPITKAPTLTPTTGFPTTISPTILTLHPTLKPTPSPTTKLKAWWDKSGTYVIIGVSVVGGCMIIGITCYLVNKCESDAVARNLRTANIELGLTNNN